MLILNSKSRNVITQPNFQPLQAALVSLISFIAELAPKKKSPNNGNFGHWNSPSLVVKLKFMWPHSFPLYALEII